MAGQDWFEKDFYADLGLTPQADQAAIKKAYRKLARKHHPDAASGSEARFKEIGEAYSVLSDAEQRQQYDSIRTATRGGPRFAPGGGGGGFEDLLGGLFTGERASRGSQRAAPPSFGQGAGRSPDLEELLSQMGGFGGFGGAPAGPQRGSDATASVTIGFREALAGSSVSLQTPQGASVSAKIPAGFRDGQQLRLRGRGAAGDRGAAAGDLLLTISIKPDPIFSRQGDDLLLTAPVSFTEATLGATIEIPTLDAAGELGTVRVKVAPGTPSGRTLRVKGRGVHTSKGVGDLRVTVQVAVPQRLNSAAREALAQYATAMDEDPRADLLAGVRAASEKRG